MPYYSDAEMSADARELILFGDNSEAVHGQKVSIIKNYIKKMKAGKYDHALAVKGWLNWLNNVSRLYQKEYGHLFAVAIRREAAKHYEEAAREELLEAAARL